MSPLATSAQLPPLLYDAWRGTLATLHRCAQIAGKIQMEHTHLVNHYWSVAFQLTTRGLTSPPLPARLGRLGEMTFSLELDFFDHALVVRTSDGCVRQIALESRPVADFYREVMDRLHALGIAVSINDRPVEIPSEAIPFHEDVTHASYDRAAVRRWFEVLSQSALVFHEFRGRFVGKCSPVHFFWGSFDLAVTRFSGRRAPERPRVDPITRESYSHEVSSAGFWSGDDRFPHAAYYSYASPVPEGLAESRIEPQGAYWHAPLGEFLLPYEVVRGSPDPRQTLLHFLQSTYEAAAELADWDRASLERLPEAPPPLPLDAVPPVQ